MHDHDGPFGYDTADFCEEVDYLFDRRAFGADRGRLPYGAERADRLRILVYVDGRLVDAWHGPVEGTQWMAVADRLDQERRPRPAPPPVPAHVRVMQWLDGLVGGREALLALDDRSVPDVGPPPIEDAEARAAYDAVAEQLDRVATTYFDEEVRLVLAAALRAVWEAGPALVTGRPANQVAGGLLWVVGRANQLFAGGLTQTSMQRELWLKPTLSQCGQRLGHVLRGVDLYDAPRPHQCPDLKSFGNPDLLTAATRRLVMRWRDQALAASRSGVLPPGVDS